MSAPTEPPSLDAGVPSLNSQQSSLSTQPSLDHVLWTKATTKNGKSYEVGMPKASADFKTGSQESGPQVKMEHGEQRPFTWPVKWPVGDATYKATTTEVYDVVGISKYALHKNKGWVNVYDYVLDFKNNVNYTFAFHDEEGDTYHVTTVVHGDHCVKYNSKKPAIKRVSSKDGKGTELIG